MGPGSDDFDGFEDPGVLDPVGQWLQIGLVVFAVVFVAVLALAVTGAVRSRKVLREAGIDPLAAQAHVVARLAGGPLGTPGTTLEQRLTELDDLHRRGLITAEEHQAGRRAALTDS